jgi:hypothetical protein
VLVPSGALVASYTCPHHQAVTVLSHNFCRNGAMALARARAAVSPSAVAEHVAAAAVDMSAGVSSVLCGCVLVVLALRLSDAQVCVSYVDL